MKIEEMNEGVQILLKRMETHPQEFSYGIHERWAYFIGEILKHFRGQPNAVSFLNDSEVQAIHKKLRDVERDEFTAQIIRQLAETPESEYQLELPYMPPIKK